MRIQKSGIAQLLTVSMLMCMCGLALQSEPEGVTRACLQDQDAITNEFTIGTCRMEIREEFQPPSAASQDTYQKKVWVRNTGTLPCYVRVFLDFTRGEAKQASSFSADGVKYYPVSEYQSAHLPVGWTYDGRDGYYYYRETLEAGEETTALLDFVRTDFAALGEKPAYDIIVYGESIQTRDAKGREFNGADAWRQAWSEFGKEG